MSKAMTYQEAEAIAEAITDHGLTDYEFTIETSSLKGVFVKPVDGRPVIVIVYESNGEIDCFIIDRTEVA